MDEQIRKYFQGELDTAERLELLKRMESDDLLKKEFIVCKNTAALLALSDLPNDSEATRKGYERFLKRIKAKRFRQQLFRIAEYAAVACLLIASTFWATVTFHEPAFPAATANKLYVPAGQRAKLTLPDGTDVWLNAQTTLTYPTFFSGKERRVLVEGEAFFDVVPDPKKPFVVCSQGVEMKVLGTKFNLYSYPKEQEMKTSLIEGSLHVYFSKSAQKGIILKPNEQVTIKEQTMKIEAIPHNDYFLWIDGIYSFENEPLINILKKLQLYYDVQIEVKDSSIFQWAYTGKFRQRDGIDEILRMIQKIHKFHIEKDEEHNQITLSKSHI